MKKIVLACDLDNTLIYSYKHKHKNDVCIETINGKEQGYISVEVLKFLADHNNALMFIPITTRSIEQYLRIKWPSDCVPEYAITTNGANLLVNSQLDGEWQNDSLKDLKEVLPELDNLYKTLSTDNRFIRCRYVDGFYIFVYCKDDISPKEVENFYNVSDKYCVRASGKKVYFYPVNINKGNALLRLKKKFGIESVISAGDSIIDIPMLDLAEVSYIPNDELNLFLKKKAVVSDEEDFSYFIIKRLSNQLNYKE